MSDTYTNIQLQPAKTAVSPLLLFSGVLALLLLISEVVWLPRMTRIEVGGVERSLPELEAYRMDLQARIMQAEDERDAFLLPVRDVSFLQAIAWKQAQEDLVSLEESLRHAATKLTDPAEMVFASIELRPADKQLVVKGDVRGVGPGSMTMLAQFLEEVKGLPNVASLTPPSFVRIDDPTIGFHSPFIFTVTLR